MGCPPPLAEEITQETFLRLHRDLHDGLEVNNVRAWIYRVARNLHIDSRREYQRQVRDPAQGYVARDPEQRLLHLERVRIIGEELSRLPELQRECLQLKAQGLRYHEIAAALDISMATAVDCVRRAVKRLGRRFNF